MFSNQKSTATKTTKRPVPTRDSAVTILTSGCHFNGKLYCRGSSRIGGKIEGEIISEGILIIEESAIINAQIKAEEAIIQGLVKGRLEAKTRVELAQNSRFEGDISTPSLVINEGATFNGRASMQIPKDHVVEGARLIDSVVDLRGRGPDAKTDPDQELERQPQVAARATSDMLNPATATS